MRRILCLGFVCFLALAPALAAGEEPGADARYRVVINHEEQYSIWLADRDLPRGWKATDFVGTKDESLEHIEEVWVDVREITARRKMALEIYQKLDRSSERRPGADARYRVVINHEEQYSIWLANRELPEGWKATDFVGTKDESLEHIEEVWTDIGPLDKRRALALEIYQKLQRQK